MAYNWVEQVYLPAEYRALLRELERKVAQQEITKEQAEREATNWKNNVMQIIHEANTIDLEEYARETRKELLKND